MSFCWTKMIRKSRTVRFHSREKIAGKKETYYFCRDSWVITCWNFSILKEDCDYVGQNPLTLMQNFMAAAIVNQQVFYLIFFGLFIFGALSCRRKFDGCLSCAECVHMCERKWTCSSLHDMVLPFYCQISKFLRSSLWIYLLLLLCFRNAAIAYSRVESNTHTRLGSVFTL